MANVFKRHYIKAQESWGDGIKTREQRIFAHIDAHLGDHAFLRLLWTNLYQLDEGVWRCNQPSPRRVKKYARMGIKTIVNLRGPSRWGSYILEKEACEKHGIQFINHRMYSRRMPTFEELKQTQAMFESLEGPVLFHCKSGADRAGICSALYLLMVKNDSPDNALKQLSIRFLHIKHSKTGRLDHFIEAYKKFYDKQPMPFMEWAEHQYDRDQLTDEFHSGKWYDWFVDKVLHRE
jgi:protein tyrosine phosphatase (PTP) superfamily phosphohydrolase (DUF442 family)